MPEQEDFRQEASEENYEDTGSQDHQSVTREQFDALQEQIQVLTSKLSQSEQKQFKDKADELTDDQWAQIAKDPKLLGQYTKKMVDKTRSEIKRDNDKVFWDNKAEQVLPNIQKDPQVKKAVVAKMREMVNMGEFTWESPTLLYRAAQLVGPQFAGKNDMNKDDSDSALDSSSSRVHRTKVDSRSSKVDDSDPRLRFAQAFGLPKEKIEEFRKGLEPYQRTERKSGKRLL